MAIISLVAACVVCAIPVSLFTPNGQKVEPTQMDVASIQTAAYITVMAELNQTLAASQPTATSEPTKTQIPQSTDTPVVPVINTPKPIQGCISNVPQVNVRGGPSTVYAIVGSKAQDECMDISGLNPERTWAKVALGWIILDYLAIDGDINSIRVITDIPPIPVVNDTSRSGVIPEINPSCDSNYSGACVPIYPPDVNCPQIGVNNFLVVGVDVHDLDRDGNGIACEE